MTTADNLMTKHSGSVGETTRFYQVLAFFVMVDLVFIGLFVTRDFLLDTPYGGFLRSEMWTIEQDRGYPEIYQYIKILLTMVLFCLIYFRRRNIAYLTWLPILLFVLLDDALQLHETFGTFLLTSFELPTVLGVGGFLYAEASLWLAVGLPLVGIVAYSYFRNPSTRTLSRRMVYIFLGLALFAGVLDGLHTFVERSGFTSGYARGVTATIEDGGEMLVLSVMVAYVFMYLQARR